MECDHLLDLRVNRENQKVIGGHIINALDEIDLRQLFTAFNIGQVETSEYVIQGQYRRKFFAKKFRRYPFRRKILIF